MIKIFLLISLIVGLFFVVGCTQEVLYDNMEAPHEIDDMELPKTTLEFTFANERQPDRDIKAALNGKVVYDGNVKFGFGTSEQVSFETSVGVFSFEVEDLTTGLKETTTINIENGLYVTVSFWDNSITINQSSEEQVRYD